MKAIAVVIYHKNVSRYPKKWVDDCCLSIRNQRVEKFDVLELNYGGENNSVYEGSLFYSTLLKNHAEAHNWICRKAVQLGYEFVFNTNIDDFYHHERIYRQLPYLLEGYDVVSANMTQINADNEVLREDILFSNMSIPEHAQKGHNVISHPVCAYSKNFIENSGLLQPTEAMIKGTAKWTDDFDLWKRSFGKFRFAIVPYTLLFYRIHSNNVSAKTKAA